MVSSGVQTPASLRITYGVGVVTGGCEEWREFDSQRVSVDKWHIMSDCIDKKIERVDRLQIDGQFDDDFEGVGAVAAFPGRACDVIALRILLPMQAMIDVVAHAETIGFDDRASVAGRAEAEGVRSQRGGRRIGVATAMLDEDAHGG